MARYFGCTECGCVVGDDEAPGAFCSCEGDVVPLATAAAKLAFKLRFTGRDDEAESVERRAA